MKELTKKNGMRLKRQNMPKQNYEASNYFEIPIGVPYKVENKDSV